MSVIINGSAGVTTNSGAVYDSLQTATAKAWNWNGLTTNKEIDFTDIPPWVKRITVMFSGVSTNGTSVKQIQIGDSGGIEITNYSASSAYFNTSGSFNNIQATSGFVINSVTATDAIAGSFTISCLDTATNTWSISGSAATGNTATALLLSGGAKALSATLTQVRITTVSGADNFDAGSINIIYE